MGHIVVNATINELFILKEINYLYDYFVNHQDMIPNWLPTLPDVQGTTARNPILPRPLPVWFTRGAFSLSSTCTLHIMH